MSYLANAFEFKDSAQLDAFNNLKVAQANTLFDSQQEYGLNLTQVWTATANGTLPTIVGANGSVSSGGNSVGPTDSSTRMTPIVVSATDTHYAVLQSQQYPRYIPGHGHEIQITGIFAAGGSASASFVLRTSTSGSVVDNSVAQASWNVDPFDGAGPSGITLDFTDIQILVIDAQMLYAGRVRVGFSVNGTTYWAHYFNVANSQAMATMQTFNLPVRAEGRTSASATVFRWGYFDSANGIFFQTSRASLGGTVQFECCSVKSYGATEQRGFPRTAANGITTIGVTTRRPVLSIRPRALFNGKTNRAHIEAIAATLRATTNDSFIELVVGGTLTGASWVPVGATATAGAFVTGVTYVIVSIGTTDFTLIGASANTVGLEFTATGAGVGTGTATISLSVAEYDISATAIVGGVIAGGAFASSGAGTVVSITGAEAALRNPLVLSKIDALTATQTPFTVVATSFTGTSNVAAILNWHEQQI